MVSTGDMTLAFEHPRMKAIAITQKSIVMTAGTIHEPDLLLQAKEIARGKERLIEIADILKEVYQEYRDKHVIDEILRPLGGIKSFGEWHGKQKSLHDGIVMELNQNIASYRLGLSLLLAGVDTTGHLIRIDDPGVYNSYDNLSYCCIGMGNRHADNVFAWYKYSATFLMNEALYIGFEAKKRAEMAGGVGKSTDILIIDEKSINKVHPDTIKLLEEIYYERESKSERAGFDKKIRELEIQMCKMEGSET